MLRTQLRQGFVGQAESECDRENLCSKRALSESETSAFCIFTSYFARSSRPGSGVDAECFGGNQLVKIFVVGAGKFVT